MVRNAQVDIPNPFKNSEYKPIFLLSTESQPVANDLNRRLLEIERNLDEVESLLGENIGRARLFSATPDTRVRLAELRRRLLSQKSLLDLRLDDGRLRHRRSTGIISSELGYSESHLDLMSLPGRYEHSKDSELKSSISMLRERLIRKRILDTALSIKARTRPEADTATLNKRLSVIEDSYEKLTGDSQKPLNQRDSQKTFLELSLDAAGSPGPTGGAPSSAAAASVPRRCALHNFLRYSNYTNKPGPLSSREFQTPAQSPMVSPQETTFSSETSSSRRVLRMVKSIESMNAAPANLNSRLVDKEKVAKLNEVKLISEKRVESLRKRLTADGFGTIDSATYSYSQFKAQKMSLKSNQETKFEPVKRNVSRTSQFMKSILDNDEIRRSQVQKSKADEKPSISQANESPEASKPVEGSENGGDDGNRDKVSTKEPSEYSDADRQLAETKQQDIGDVDLETVLGELTKEESVKSPKKRDYPDVESPDKETKTNAAPAANIETEELHDSVLGMEVDSLRAARAATTEDGLNRLLTKTSTTTTSHTQQRNSTSLVLRISMTHEYAYTKPDLNLVVQNLTYRKSAFVDQDEEESAAERAVRASDNSDIFHPDPYAFSVQEKPASRRGSLDHDLKLQDYLPPMDKHRFSHQPAHLITSNVSVVERVASKRGSVAEEPTLFDGSGMFENDTKALRRKISSRRSFNVLKQLMIELDYSKRSAVQHRVESKRVLKQKSGFFRRLARLFKRG